LTNTNRKPWDRPGANFLVIDAAALWCDIQPTAQIRENPPYEVQWMAKLILSKAPFWADKIFGITDPDPRLRNVTREQLIKIAEELNEKPNFLYPECREGEKLHHGEKTSLLKVIIGLLPERIDPNKPDAVGKLKQALELNGIPLDEKTIRRILKEIKPLMRVNTPSKTEF
jgi:hypothetical protein